MPILISVSLIAIYANLIDQIIGYRNASNYLTIIVLAAKTTFLFFRDIRTESRDNRRQEIEIHEQILLKIFFNHMWETMKKR
jgi:pilus assembly protein TadC